MKVILSRCFLGELHTYKQLCTYTINKKKVKTITICKIYDIRGGQCYNMFQIVCKSNECLDYYPDNKANNFQKKVLPLTHQGYNTLEVALVEIVVPSEIKNVRNGYNTIEISQTEISENPDGTIKASEFYVPYTIEPGSYTLNSLIDEINKKVNYSMTLYFKLGLNKKTNQAWLSTDKEIKIKFGIDIAKILGYNAGEWIKLSKEKELSTYQFGPRQDLSMLHIYSNVVAESYMGEFTHQLLRIVNWNQSGKKQNSASLTYDRPYFMPVKHTDIDTIQIEIRDNLNIPVEFVYADEPVMAILEFREKKL